MVKKLPASWPEAEAYWVEVLADAVMVLALPDESLTVVVVAESLRW